MQAMRATRRGRWGGSAKDAVACGAEDYAKAEFTPPVDGTSPTHSVWPCVQAVSVPQQQPDVINDSVPPLRQGIDCMARCFSLLDWGVVSSEELDTLVHRLQNEVHWHTKQFGGCPRDVASWIFTDCNRDTPPPLDMDCVRPLTAKLLDMLDQVHVGDLVFPLQLYVNRYNNGSIHTRMHVHYCRQVTFSLGNVRALDVEGPGIPAGKRRLDLHAGDVVLLDGQSHGVVADVPEAGLRFSINMFYCTAEDLQELVPGDRTTQRRGRSAVSVQYSPQVAPVKYACFKCGFHHLQAARCNHSPLARSWNAGNGIVEVVWR